MSDPFHQLIMKTVSMLSGGDDSFVRTPTSLSQLAKTLVNLLNASTTAHHTNFPSKEIMAAFVKDGPHSSICTNSPLCHSSLDGTHHDSA